MDIIREDEADLVGVAMDLDVKLGQGRDIPHIEMKIIAVYHPEKETRRLVGKVMVTKLVHGNAPAEKRLGELKAIAVEERCHPEVRADACAVLRRVLSEQERGEELASMALDGRYPKKGREDFASAYFLSQEIEQEKALEILGCADLGEEFRQSEGMRIVDRGLARDEPALISRIAEDKRMPSMLKVYARSALGRGGGFPKERKSVPPAPESMAAALAGARNKAI